MNTAAPAPASTYIQFRSRILDLNPDELGLTPTPSAPHVWGVLVEMGYEVGSATLVALVDGTTSLHYSTGGGLLGSPGYAPLAEASRALVIQAENFLQLTSLTHEFPLPQAGQVRFILLTYSGTYAANAAEKSLTADGHPLSPLYKYTQSTLSQLRLLAEKKHK
jgi:hypothetical protein